jgi:putative ABC transport system permease protein
VLGLGLAFVMVKALAGFGLGSFEVPVGGVVAVVLLGSVLAVLASFRPARRAAKLEILAAIATD